MTATALKDANIVQPGSLQLSMKSSNAFQVFKGDSKTVQLTDESNNPIDLSAGTISYSFDIAKNLGVSGNGHAEFDDSGFALSGFTPVAIHTGDASGNLTFGIKDSASGTPPPAGTYQVSVYAVDSAGGIKHLVAVGTVAVQEIP